MRLIYIQGDVIVASEVVAITREDTTLTVVLRTPETSIEFEFDTELKAAHAMQEAVNVLLELGAPAR